MEYRVQHKLPIQAVNKFTVVPEDVYGGEGGEQYQNHLMCYSVLSNAKLLLCPPCLQIFPLAMAASVWSSDRYHMDCGQENTELVVTLSTPSTLKHS